MAVTISLCDQFRPTTLARMIADLDYAYRVFPLSDLENLLASDARRTLTDLVGQAVADRMIAEAVEDLT